MRIETENGIWADADAKVCRILIDGNRTVRRLLAADRTIAGAIRRVAALRARLATQAASEHARAGREVDREMAASWGRDIHVRMPVVKRKSVTETKTRRAKLLTSISRRALNAYREPLSDARGRIALYFRVRYVGFKSKTWRPGLAADHIGYILRPQALENGDAELHLTPISNMGETEEEITACWRALETVEGGYRANAIVQYRIVLNLPHGLTSDERRELVEDFCERTFGRLGLPYVAAIHEPDAKGDQRNFHAHIAFSTRPCERTGDHQWLFAQEKVNGLTDKAGLRLMRALVAGHLNLACRKARLNVRYTHQTYAERKIDAVRQEHVGPERMAAHDRGEAVAVIAKNEDHRGERSRSGTRCSIDGGYSPAAARGIAGAQSGVARRAATECGLADVGQGNRDKGAVDRHGIVEAAAAVGLISTGRCDPGRCGSPNM